MGGDDFSAQRAALGAHFKARIPALLEAWGAVIAADPQLTTGDSLPRGQLVDHLPMWLDTFASALGEVRELERRRAELWQQAAHDLHGNRTCGRWPRSGVSRSP